mmetsp:Transcript_52842/g.87774  ORF Transcript_52842/g.87774 Transcript_52842/m.87774 type:complete len:243 (-) Transcript_52842:38-766(-)
MRRSRSAPSRRSPLRPSTRSCSHCSSSSVSTSANSTRVTAAQSAFRLPIARTSRSRCAGLGNLAAFRPCASSDEAVTKRFLEPCATSICSANLSCASMRTGCSQTSSASSMSSHPSGAAHMDMIWAVGNNSSRSSAEGSFCCSLPTSSSILSRSSFCCLESDLHALACCSSCARSSTTFCRRLIARSASEGDRGPTRTTRSSNSSTRSISLSSAWPVAVTISMGASAVAQFSSRARIASSPT